MGRSGVLDVVLPTLVVVVVPLVVVVVPCAVVVVTGRVVVVVVGDGTVVVVGLVVGGVVVVAVAPTTRHPHEDRHRDNGGAGRPESMPTGSSHVLITHGRGRSWLLRSTTGGGGSICHSGSSTVWRSCSRRRHSTALVR